MTKYPVLLFIVLLSLSACGASDPTTAHKPAPFEDKYTFKLKNSFTITLDSLTDTGESCYQYLTQGDDEWLAFDNKKTNTIYIHRLKTQEKISQIRLPREGSEGIGEMDGFYMQTLDSIFVPSTSTQAIYLVNGQGKILRKYPYDRSNRSDIMQIFFTNYTPPVIKDGKLYCVSYIIRHKPKHKGNIQILDLASGTWSADFESPSEYKDKFYGVISFYRLHLAYNDRFYVSYPASHYLHAYAPGKKDTSYYAGSKFLGEVKPLSTNPFQMPFQDGERYFRQTPSYSGIYYDKYRQLYYRIAHHPISDDNLKASEEIKRHLKNYSIVILDQQLKKVGEFMPAPYTYAWQIVIPTKSGVVIKNFKKSNDKDDEDHDYYDVFEVVQK